jgi:phospholipid-binding lipoprotein MlaA
MKPSLVPGGAAPLFGRWRGALWPALCAVLLAAGGCATVPPGAGSNPVDPLERVNRHIYAFNDGFDRAVARPVARGYVTVVPQFVRNCVGNIFANVGEVGNTINAALQFKPADVATDVGRFFVNSTVGVLGCFDVAKDIGWERNRQDVGLTMGKWGIPDGPYLVLPFFGPRSTRDAFGEIGDAFTDPVSYVTPSTDYWLLYGTRFVDRRAQFLDTSHLVDDAALDSYAFVRDGYLQRRRSRIYDGNPPPSMDVEDPDSPDTPPAAVPPAK